jgi:UDP-glucose 4-epimerase
LPASTPEPYVQLERILERDRVAAEVRVLVTGGAGFIGSHLVDTLVERGDSVIVLDDLFSGYHANVNSGSELVEASVADHDAMRAAIAGSEVVFHQAAHRAVMRSVQDPLATDTANVHGTLTVLKAALDAGVRRVVYASSSSVYGGAETRPTPETAPLTPRSPYAVSKAAGEQYCRVFSELYDLETVSLRYFNVFGPRQRPDSAYSAVIPLFIDALQRDGRPEIHGDGKQSRDFTYISDVVAANLAAASAPPGRCSGRAYNVAPGNAHSLIELLHVVAEIMEVEPHPVHTDPRPGDVRHTCGDPTAAERDLDFRCHVTFDEGLRRTVDWFMAR